MREPKYNPSEIRADLDKYGSLHLEYKWSVSRGRETYGYNICTLRVYGQPVSRCCGGGYDMSGTCLGEFVTAIMQSEIDALAAQAVHNERGYSDGREYGCYGLISWSDDRHAHIDGGCGTTESILRELGYKLRYQSKNNYILEKVGE